MTRAPCTQVGAIGVWLIGSKGGVAITTIVGLVALKKGLVASTGLVSQLAEFANLDLASWDEFVIGGHEIRGLPLCREAYRVTTEMRAASREVIDQCRDELERIEARIRPGTAWNVGPTIAALADLDIPQGETPRQIVDRLQDDLRHFRQSEKLDHAIVVNVASTEPPLAGHAGRFAGCRLAGDLVRARAPLERRGLPPAGQFVVCDCRAGPGLLVHQLYAVARGRSGRHR